MYPLVRKEAGYERSLGVLRSIKRASPGVVTKSAILAGLGELPEEIIEAMRDLREADCDILTIGQYLRPSPENRPVARFVPPEEFESLKVIGEGLGFKSVNAGPFARSSYMAEKYYKERSFSAYNAPIGRIV
jgi:lipoic acid synthetase